MDVKQADYICKKCSLGFVDMDDFEDSESGSPIAPLAVKEAVLVPTAWMTCPRCSEPLFQTYVQGVSR